MSVERDNFFSQLKVLKKYYRVVPLIELLSQWEKGKNGPYEVSITFDDGYRDIYTLAYPVLKELGLPATLFFTSSLGDGRFLWYDAFQELRRHFPARELLGRYSNLLGRKFSSLHEVFSYIKYYKDPVLVLQNFCKVNALVYPEDSGSFYLSLEELFQMRDIFTYGCHGVSHRCFTALTPQDVEEEIGQSFEYLRMKLECVLPVFAFPFGRKQDVPGNVSHLLKRYGFSYALSAEGGCLKKTTNRFFIPRIGIENWSHRSFLWVLEKF